MAVARSEDAADSRPRPELPKGLAVELPYWLTILREFVLGEKEHTAIPPLDGPLAPNNRLEEFASVGVFSEINDVACSASNELFVSTGRSVVRCRGEDYRDRSVVAQFTGNAGSLAFLDGEKLLVCVSGVGVVEVSSKAQSKVLIGEILGKPLRCATGLAVGSDGALYVTEGSIKYSADDWVWSLMKRDRSGRLIRYDLSARRAEVVREGMAFPNGLCPSVDNASLLITQAWDHSVNRYHLEGPRRGEFEVVRKNLVGYPAGISVAPEGGYWLSVFALRTQLVEFLLTQHAFRDEMMRTVDPLYWIRPALRTLNSGLEPLQGGAIKKLGRAKPWAPPRSYGLVVKLNQSGELLESFHSRADGVRHGVVSARQFGDALLVCCKGNHELLRYRVKSDGLV